MPRINGRRDPRSYVYRGSPYGTAEGSDYARPSETPTVPLPVAECEVVDCGEHAKENKDER